MLYDHRESHEQNYLFHCSTFYYGFPKKCLKILKDGPIPEFFNSDSNITLVVSIILDTNIRLKKRTLVELLVGFTNLIVNHAQNHLNLATAGASFRDTAIQRNLQVRKSNFLR